MSVRRSFRFFIFVLFSMRVYSTFGASAGTKPLRMLNQGDYVIAIYFSKDGKTIVTTGLLKGIRLWSVETGRLVGEVKGAFPLPVALSPDGYTLACSIPGENGVRWKGRIQLWDMRTRKIQRLIEDGSMLRSLAFSPDGKHLASVGVFFRGGVSLRIWDVTTGRLLNDTNPYEFTGALQYSRDGSGILDGVYLWNSTTGVLKRRKFFDPLNVIWSVETSPDGKLVACAGDEKKPHGKDILSVYPSGGGPSRPLFRRYMTMSQVAFSPDSSLLAVVNSFPLNHGDKNSMRGSVELWDPRTGRLERTIAKQNAAMTCIAFSPDGALLATGDEEGVVKFWPVRDAPRKAGKRR